MSNKCEFCGNPNGWGKTVADGGTDIRLNSANGELNIWTDDYESGECHIAYCPFCGRNLRPYLNLLQKVKTERNELARKLDRLNDVLNEQARNPYGPISFRQKQLLELQRDCMNKYLNILDLRIKNLEEEYEH
ncbi:MAG: hypothetical protein HUJ64_08715 [Limosilactobacillus mucosae]|nr:hypothetical protein [Limosilactobacillus mucosae]